jgi:uncharacterized protein (TIGR03083 family)
MVSDPVPWLRSVRRSHERLAAQVGELPVSAYSDPSYDDEWSIAQVLSHLGSQAEIFSLFVEAGLEGTEAPSQSAFGPIWDRWNNKTAAEQVADSIAANEALLARLEGLDSEQLTAFRLEMFGMDLDITGLLRMRLSEHAVHSWDVAVTIDPSAEVTADAVELLIDGLPDLAARAGKPTDGIEPIAVSTTTPERHFLLVPEGVRLEPASDGATHSVELPAEAFLRLLYGRLDESHPAHGDVHTSGVTVDELRSLFPGF